MFTQLNPLLATCASLTLTIVANDDGTLSVTIIPKAKKDSENAAALNTPLLLTATPSELDGEFIGIITSYNNKRQSLAEQLEATEAVLEAAKKEAASKAVKAVKKSAGKPEKPKSESLDDDGDGGGDGEGEGSSTDTTSTTSSASADNLWE